MAKDGAAIAKTAAASNTLNEDKVQGCAALVVAAVTGITNRDVMKVDVALPLAFITPPRYHPLHSNLCSTQGRVLARPFSFAGTGGRGRNAIRATDRQTGQTEELSALQSRENGRKRAVPPLPLQTAGPHAPAAARHRTAGGVDRRQRLARRRELLRRPLQVHPGVRRGTLAVIPPQWSSSTDLPAVHFTTRPSRVLTQTSFASLLLALVK